MMTEQELEAFRESYESLKRFSARYRGDEALRARIENGDYGDLPGELLAGAEIRVVCQTPEVFYMPMPDDPGKVLSDQDLTQVSAGLGTFTTVGEVSASVLTYNCVGGTFSSQSSVSPQGAVAAAT